MTLFTYLQRLHEVCAFQTREGKKIGLASKSELRRWIKNGVVTINGHKVTEDEALDYPIVSVKLFTKRNTVTIL